jgi:hypothetical protein
MLPKSKSLKIFLKRSAGVLIANRLYARFECHNQIINKKKGKIMDRFYQWIWNLIYKIYDVQNTPFSGCFEQVFCYDNLIDNIVTLIACQHQFNKYKKEYEREHKKKYVYHLDVPWDEVLGYDVGDDEEDNEKI